VAARVLRHIGAEVDVCRNVTDVDDDIIEKARKEGVDWRTLGTEQTYRFEEDMRRLRVVKPAYEPFSRNFIDEIVSMSAALLDSGHAYERDGSVFLRGRGGHRAAG